MLKTWHDEVTPGIIFRRIGEYEAEHPDAEPGEVARALGCTAGDVERRQAMLERLLAEQAGSAEEEGDGADTHRPQGRPGGSRHLKRAHRQV